MAAVGSTIVSFFCHKCGQALKLDPSLTNSPDRAICNEIAGLAYQSTYQDEVDNRKKVEQFVDYTVSHSKQIISMQKSRAPIETFELVDALAEMNPDSDRYADLTHKVIVHSHLFDLLSEHSEIDHPLCEECCDMLLDQIDVELSTSEEQCRQYNQLLDSLQNDSLESETLEEQEKLLDELRLEADGLVEEIRKCEAECKRLDNEMIVEQGKQNDINAETNECHKEYHELKRRLISLEDENKSTACQLKFIQQQLDNLIKTNTFNWAFHIWHDKQFGTINNFRLGRLPNVPVDWNEVNTAWGLTALLLHSLANKLNLKFERFKLVPFGNLSYLVSLAEPNKELPLHWSGGFKIFKDTKFDQAMIAFLDLVQQFGEFIKSKQIESNSTWKLPYGMEHGKLIDTTNSSHTYSVKVQFNSEEQWTKALKFLLTNLRWGLTWVATLDSSQ